MEKITEKEFGLIEKAIERQVDVVIEHFNDFILFFFRQEGVTLEERISDIEKEENWDEKNRYCPFKKKLHGLLVGLTEHVCTNLRHSLGLGSCDYDLVKIILKRVFVEEPRIKDYIEAIARGVDIQTKIRKSTPDREEKVREAFFFN